MSSWSLHRSLGRPAFYGANEKLPSGSHNQGALSLLELPKAIADIGITTLEIVHFHLPSTDDAYLAELRAELETAGVELFSLLIDAGDITHPEHGERDLAWMEGWLDVAAKLGCRCARVIAGKQDPSDEVLRLSAKRLTRLANKADALGLRLMTENWFGTTSTPETVLWLLDALEGQLGLCVDFGNWQGEDKYENLARIVKHAESCHAKASFEGSQIQQKDYQTCLDLTKRVNFQGPYTLIFDSPEPNEWQGLGIEREIVQAYVS